MVRASVSLAHHPLPTRSLMNTPVVLITGALTGIGHATARAFAHEGARIVVSGRRDEAGQALAGELRALGVEAEFVNADVRKEEEVRSLIDRTIKRFRSPGCGREQCRDRRSARSGDRADCRELRGYLRH